MIKMVVFDMAGTTVDEDNVVYKTVRQALAEAGYEFTLDQVLAEGAGKEKLQAIKTVLKVYGGVEDDAIAQKVYDRFVVLLREAYSDLNVMPQPHAVELFQGLKQRGIQVVLNTGYNAETAERLVKKLGWRKGLEFDQLVTASDVTKNRPDPDMILLAMERAGIADGSHVVKVGDSIIDIQEGRNAGCALNIGITTGAHTPEQLRSAAPDAVIDDLLELLPIVDKA